MTKKGIVQAYGDLEIDERLNFIFRHFDNFIELVDVFEDSLSEEITEEKLYNRRTDKVELGVRVQASGKSDPTGSTATNNVVTIQQIRSGNPAEILEDTDDASGHLLEIETLRLMRKDYKSLTRAMKILPIKERKELSDMLTGERDLTEIAEDSGTMYDSAKVRIYRSRRKVKELATELIERRMPRSA